MTFSMGYGEQSGAVNVGHNGENRLEDLKKMV
jgi:hypothetical protein